MSGGTSKNPSKLELNAKSEELRKTRGQKAFDYMHTNLNARGI